VQLDPSRAPTPGAPEPALGGLPTLRATGRLAQRRSRSWWPYRPVEEVPAGDSTAIELTAVPYYAWGNRGAGPMRVWVPVTD
jgi:uncharacterized protein